MGLGSHGQLGQGLFVSRSVFESVQNTFDGRVRHVACGAMHSMAVCENGHLFGWGINENGMLGVESDEERINLPTKVEFTSVPGMSAEVNMISCGPFHNACIDATGVLYTWGNGGQGRLGHGDRSSESTPTRVKTFHQLGLRVVAVACGSAHTLAITHNGAVYAWGCGLHGRLGNGSQRDAWSPIKITFKEPSLLKTSEQFRRVACGAFHSIVVTSEGRIAVWGCNRDGQLGIDPLEEKRTVEEGKEEVKSQTMVLIPTFLDKSTIHNVQRVACGSDRTILLTNQY
jgi:alpha-tubulin suppressor-like RCC1 family protein